MGVKGKLKGKEQPCEAFWELLIRPGMLRFRKAKLGQAGAAVRDEKKGRRPLGPLHPAGSHTVATSRMWSGWARPCTRSKLISPSGLCSWLYPAVVQAEREEDFWSPGEFEMLQALPQHRVRWGGAVRLSSRLPPSGRWTSSSGRRTPDGKGPAHEANFRLHRSNGSSLHKAPCPTQLRFQLRGHSEGKENIHIRTPPCIYIGTHAHTAMHRHSRAYTPRHRHTPFLQAGLINALSCPVRGRESL